MKFKRQYLSVLEHRLIESRKFIQVLAGPRQVGKTTLVKQLQKNLQAPSHYASADNIVEGNVWIAQQWEVARIQIKQSECQSFVLILDEIQKIPNWSEAVKRLWDEDTVIDRSIKVILLGSSRLLLQQGLTESLAGRYELTYIPHWSFGEMESAFGWSADQYIWFGGYPGAADLISDEERWRKYVRESLVETSISKDILMLTRVDKPALIRRLFDLGCTYSGQILSYNKMVGQLQEAGNTTTLAHYLTLLGQAGLLTGLDKYAGTVLSQRASSPKLQVHNTAFLSSMHPLDFKTIQLRLDIWGRLVESSVGAHLINESFNNDFKVFYWREGNNEVDFVLERRGKTIGIEVKSGGSGYTPGMAAFQKSYQPDRVLLVGETGLPIDAFLKMDTGDLF